MGEIKYYTEEGLNALKEELNQLETTERIKVAQAIAEARDKGDLSENAEYDAAKEQQSLLEVRIQKLQALVANARIIDEDSLDNSKILLFSTVKITNMATHKEFYYTIVPETEANLKEMKISVTSPIAKGLLGHSKGEEVEITIPAGTMKFRIDEITRK
ncbi:MAG: transcription elongation factor GreA [Bacteroidales bacterium]|nr:transcription elongation factor GreA [Bacteroidales bacterium]